MPGEEKEGIYCTVCGGIPPDQVKIRKVVIDGKETGIDRLDWILADVSSLGLQDDDAITDAIVERVQKFNYIPGKKMAEYRAALLREYKAFRSGRRTGVDDGA
ncbi:MAG: NAC family transcription factor [Methanolinea sp.]